MRRIFFIYSCIFVFVCMYACTSYNDIPVVLAEYRKSPFRTAQRDSFSFLLPFDWKEDGKDGKTTSSLMRTVDTVLVKNGETEGGETDRVEVRKWLVLLRGWGHGQEIVIRSSVRT